MRVPNARVLVTGVLVFWAGLSATGYLAVVYFQKVQHAGANVQTIVGYLTGVPVVMLGLALGFVLSRFLTRKQVAILTPLAGSVVSVVQFTTTHIWQTVVLAFVGGPLFAAFIISLAPMLLQLLPRSGGMAELLGKLVAPFSLFAVAFSFLAAWVVDVTGDYRVIWLFPAAAGVVQAVVMCWLKVPKGHERAEFGDLPQRMSDSMLEQVIGQRPSAARRRGHRRRCRRRVGVRHGAAAPRGPVQTRAPRRRRGHRGWGHRGWGHRGWGHRGWGHRGWGHRGWGHRRPRRRGRGRSGPDGHRARRGGARRTRRRQQQRPRCDRRPPATRHRLIGSRADARAGLHRRAPVDWHPARAADKPRGVPSPELLLIANLLRSTASDRAATPVDEQRAQFESVGAVFPVPEGVTCTPVDAGGVRCEWVHAPATDPGRVVLYLHGGGYVIGSIDTHRLLAARLSAAAQAPRAGGGIPPRPGAPLPRRRRRRRRRLSVAARWWRGQPAPGRGGRLGGGGAGPCRQHAARDDGEPLPRALVAFSPWVDLALRGDTMVSQAEHEVVVPPALLRRWAAWYLDGADAEAPLASPLYGDLRALPPLLVLVGTDEVLYDDAIRLVGRAHDAGVEVTLEEFADCFHLWTVLAATAPEAGRATDLVGAFLRSHLEA